MLIPLFITATWFAARRLLTLLRFLQQEEYDRKRFRRWWWDNRLFDRRLSAYLLGIGIVAWWVSVPVLIGFLTSAFAIYAWLEPDPRKTGKKKLVLTPRARRIFWIALADWVIAQILMLWFEGRWLPLGEIMIVQALPFALTGAVAVAQRFENRVQKKFWREAHDRLGDLKPFVIGVTGSYGKTSVKHILGHILQMAAPTLVTPGSVNTAMGIARIVRENLRPEHKYFIVEMGAYGPGSIAALCALAPPDMGIITAVAFAHYERFKSLETVAATKFELAEAVAAKGGKMIAATATLDYPAPRALRARLPNLIVPVGGILAEHTDEGLRVALPWQGKTHHVEVPLFGLHQAENVALAFTAACTLGLSPDTVRLALKSLPQIQHRLEVRPGGPTIIDDAYNSNPDGFSAALDLLDHLKKPGGRRILVTPGMVELGALHDEKHRVLGAKAAQTVDILIAVLPERIRAFTEAFSKGDGTAGRIVEVPSFGAAQAWLNENARADDIVLLENDLPDLYEALPRF